MKKMFVIPVLVVFSILTAGCTQNSLLKAPVPSGPVVVMMTTMGTIEITLDSNRAPETVKNFMSYVNDGFYTGTLFHRVIPDFMIQGGGYDMSMAEKRTKPPIRNEAGNGLLNRRGTIAMARSTKIDSADAQFFINVKDNPSLNQTSTSQKGFGYAVFGRVTAGMEVVDMIVGVPTQSQGDMNDVPQKKVIILSVTVKE